MAIDDDLKSRYDTGTNQVPGMWFEINLPSETDVAGLELDAGSSPRDFPRGYKVELSSDGKNGVIPSPPVTGRAPDGNHFPARPREVHPDHPDDMSPGHDWSIQDLQVPSPPRRRRRRNPSRPKNPRTRSNNARFAMKIGQNR